MLLTTPSSEQKHGSDSKDGEEEEEEEEEEEGEWSIFITFKVDQNLKPKAFLSQDNFFDPFQMLTNVTMVTGFKCNRYSY